MRAIILGLCAVLAFASCDGDGGGKKDGPDGGALLDFGTTAEGYSNYALTPIGDDPNEAISKVVYINKTPEGKFLTKQEVNYFYNDEGFVSKIPYATYVSNDGVDSENELSNSTTWTNSIITVTYQDRGLQKKTEQLTKEYRRTKLHSSYSETDLFHYDDKDRLIAVEVSSSQHTVDTYDDDGDGDTEEYLDDPQLTSTALSFTYDEEKDGEILRHDYLVQADGSQKLLGTSVFNHAGIFLRSSNTVYSMLAESQPTLKMCKQGYTGSTGILTYETNERTLFQNYEGGESIAENEYTTTQPYTRSGNEAELTVEEKDSTGAVKESIISRISFQKLKKPVKSFFFGSVSIFTDYQPVSLLRNPAILWGRFFATPGTREILSNAELVPASCNPADGAARAAAPVEGGLPEQPPVEVPPPGAEPPPGVPVRLDCVQGQELVEDACVPTVATCNEQNKIRNANGECEACANGSIPVENECRLAPCPAGQHRSFLRCVADCAAGQHQDWLGRCVRDCPEGQHSGWLGGCVAD